MKQEITIILGKLIFRLISYSINNNFGLHVERVRSNNVIIIQSYVNRQRAFNKDGLSLLYICCFAFRSSSFGRPGCRTKTNMASSMDVHVRICGQEIIKYDLEIKALIQVSVGNVFSVRGKSVFCACGCRCGGGELFVKLTLAEPD